VVLAEDLRQAVLQAALQGKLTEQLETDSNVDDLLNKIQNRKEILIKTKEIKKSKTDLSVDEDDFLFQIPSNWRWVKLGRIATVKGGKRVPVGETLVDVDTGHKYIRVADMKNGTVDESDIKYITDEVYDVIKNYFITKNDIYITVAGTTGRVGRIPNALDMANLTENADKIVFEYLNKEWFIDVLNSKTLQWQIVQATKKVGQPKLALNKIETLLIPLPPIEEQQRIVDKINEIMPKIDEYERIEKELETLKKEYPQNMKDALLQAAMQGKLTEQLKSDSSVDELLVLIKKEKEELIAQKKIKKEKPLPDIEEEEMPFDIPENWRWVRMGNIIKLTSGQDLQSDKYSENRIGIPYLTGASNFQEGNLLFNRYTSNATSIAYNGDLLLTCKGTIGEMAFLNIEKAHIARQIMSISKLGNIDLKYIKICLENFILKLKANARSIIPGIDRKVILNLPIPIPPIEEQKRIVERLDALLPLCEDLKEN